MPGPAADADQPVPFTAATTGTGAAAATAAEAAQEPAPPRPVDVLVLGGLVALGPLTTDLYLPALPALTIDLHSVAPVTQLTLTGSMLGLALGQLLFGPLSDRLGRRRPLLAGMVVYTLATLLCLAADSATVLIVGRFAQGAAGAAGLVIARAIARDRYAGTAMIRFLASLGLISGLAPILAPVVGAQVLRFTSWRGTFGVLAALGAVLTVGVLVLLRESLPLERRHSDGLSTTVRAIGGLLADRPFFGYLLTTTFAFGALFAYIGGSSVVLQSVYGISPQTYSLVFAVNSIAVVGFTQLNGRVLVQRVTGPVLMAAGLGTAALAGAAIIVFSTVWPLGLAGVWPALFTLMAAMGVILPNSSAQALTMAPHAAGSAAALLGTGTFLCGSLVAPLSSTGGHPSVPVLGLLVLVSAVLAGAAFTLLCRPWAKQG